MSPLAFVQCLAYAAANGELKNMYSSACFMACASRTAVRGGGNGEGLVVSNLAIPVFGPTDVAVLVLNGLLAFGLNYVSFSANKKAGALSMTVAGACYLWLMLTTKAEFTQT